VFSIVIEITTAGFFLGDVFIHDTATVHSSAVIGPNVSVGNGAQIGAGVRVCNSIILPGAELKVTFCFYQTLEKY